MVPSEIWEISENEVYKFQIYSTCTSIYCQSRTPKQELNGGKDSWNVRFLCAINLETVCIICLNLASLFEGSGFVGIHFRNYTN